MAHERLLSVALDHLDNSAVAYCAERLMTGLWDENSTADTTATTLRLHLRAIPAAKAALDDEGESA